MKHNISIILLVCIFFSINPGFSQTEQQTIIPKKQKGSTYIMWGYTRGWYSKSDIHFKDNTNTYYPTTGRYHDYDFTIYDAKAKDRPDFDKIKDVINVTIPQFVVHVGYYFNNAKDLGIELNYDHTKYVVTDYQTVRVKGTFNGNYVDKDTVLDPSNFLHFEHTDGANFFMVNLIKRWKLYEPSKKFNIGYVVKPGIGFVYPRTDVTILGTGLNNNWHVAGWIAGIESGLRIEFLKHGVLEFVGKGSYADYRKVLILGENRARHHFFAGQLTLTLGAMF